MPSERSFICKLGGFSDSNPEIVTIFPEFGFSPSKSKELLSYCLPEGCQDDEFRINDFGKGNIISYIFRNPRKDGRDDLISYSILLKEGENPEVYVKLLKEVFETLKRSNLLTEEILIQNLEHLYEGLNTWTDITVEGFKVNLSSLYKNLQEKNIKPKLKGSFF